MADFGAGVHPATNARAQHRSAEPRKLVRQPRPRALLVEDDVMIAMAMEFFLHQEGWRVIGPIQSGEQAIEPALADRPDAILMDIRLNGAIDGLQAAEVIRGRVRTPINFCGPRGRGDCPPRGAAGRRQPAREANRSGSAQACAPGRPRRKRQRCERAVGSRADERLDINNSPSLHRHSQSAGARARLRARLLRRSAGS